MPVTIVTLYPEDIRRPSELRRCEDCGRMISASIQPGWHGHMHGEGGRVNCVGKPIPEVR